MESNTLTRDQTDGKSAVEKERDLVLTTLAKLGGGLPQDDDLVREGTKLILTGDPTQIDNPYLDASSNGLSFLVERLKGKGLVGHVTLAKSERSELASLAAELL